MALKLVAHASASLEMSSSVLSCGPLSRLCCMNSVSRLWIKTFFFFNLEKKLDRHESLFFFKCSVYSWFFTGIYLTFAHPFLFFHLMPFYRALIHLADYIMGLLFHFA